MGPEMAFFFYTGHIDHEYCVLPSQRSKCNCIKQDCMHASLKMQWQADQF